MLKREYKKIVAVKKRVSDQINGQIDRDNRVSAGLSREGYLGGYEQALNDVLLFLNSGARPTTRGFWE